MNDRRGKQAKKLQDKIRAKQNAQPLQTKYKPDVVIAKLKQCEDSYNIYKHAFLTLKDPQDIKKMHDAVDNLFKAVKSLNPPSFINGYYTLIIKTAILLGKMIVNSDKDALQDFNNRKPFVDALRYFNEASKNKQFNYLSDYEFQHEFVYALNTYQEFITNKITPFKMLDSCLNILDMLDTNRIAISFADKCPHSLMKLCLYHTYYFSAEMWEINQNDSNKKNMIYKLNHTYENIYADYNKLNENNELSINKIAEQLCVNMYAHTIALTIKPNIDHANVFIDMKWLLHLIKKYLIPNCTIMSKLNNSEITNNQDILWKPYDYTLQQLDLFMTDLNDSIQSLKENTCDDILFPVLEALDFIKPHQTLLANQRTVFTKYIQDTSNLSTPNEQLNITALKKQMGVIEEAYKEYKNEFETSAVATYKKQDELLKKTLSLLVQIFPIKENNIFDNSFKNSFLLLKSKILALMFDIIRSKNEALLTQLPKNKSSIQCPKEMEDFDKEGDLYQFLVLQEYIRIFNNNNLAFNDDANYIDDFFYCIYDKHLRSSIFESTESPQSIRQNAKYNFFNIQSDIQTALSFAHQCKPSGKKLAILAKFHFDKQADIQSIETLIADPITQDFWATYNQLNENYAALLAQSEQHVIPIPLQLDQIRANLAAYYVELSLEPLTRGLLPDVASRKVHINPNEILRIINKSLLVNYSLLQSINVAELRNSATMHSEYEFLFNEIIRNAAFLNMMLILTKREALTDSDVDNNKYKPILEGIDAASISLCDFLQKMLVLYKTQYLFVFSIKKHEPQYAIVGQMERHLKQYNIQPTSNQPKEKPKATRKPKPPKKNRFYNNSQVMFKPATNTTTPKPRTPDSQPSIEAPKLPAAELTTVDQHTHISPPHVDATPLPQNNPTWSEKLFPTLPIEDTSNEDNEIDSPDAIIADKQALIRSKEFDPIKSFELMRRAADIGEFEFYASVVEELLPKTAKKIGNQYKYLLNSFSNLAQHKYEFPYFNKKMKNILFGASNNTNQEQILSLDRKLAEYQFTKNTYDEMFRKNSFTLPPQLQYGLTVGKIDIDNHSKQLAWQAEECHQYTDALDKQGDQGFDEYRIGIGYKYAALHHLSLTREEALWRGQKILNENRKKLKEEKLKNNEDPYIPVSKKSAFRKALKEANIIAKNAKMLLNNKKITMDDFPPLPINQSSTPIHLPPDVQPYFSYLKDHGFQDLKLGGSRTVLHLINSLLGYPITFAGDYDFTSNSDKATLIAAGFIQSLHIPELYHAPNKTMRLSVYVPNNKYCPDITIAALKIREDGTIEDPTGEGLDDLYGLRIRCFGNAQEVINDDPIKALRIIKYKNMLWHYGFTIDPITEQALHHCKPNPKTNKDHLRDVVQKEIAVYGKEYVKDLIHYGLLKKLFGIREDMDLDETMNILKIQLNKKEVKSSLFSSPKKKVEHENPTVKKQYGLG